MIGAPVSGSGPGVTEVFCSGFSVTFVTGVDVVVFWVVVFTGFSTEVLVVFRVDVFVGFSTEVFVVFKAVVLVTF